MRDLKRTRRLVGLRRRIEDQRRGTLLRAEAEVQRAADEMRAAEASREAHAARVVQLGVGTAGALKTAVADHEAAIEAVSERRVVVAEREGVATVARRALGEASRATKALERLEARLEAERRAERQKAEQELLDELAARRGHAARGRGR